MKKPGGMRGFVGLPVVTGAVILLGLFALYQIYLVPDGWWFAVVPIVVMGWVMKAHEEVRAYRQWKQAWDGMAPEGPKARLSANKGVRVLGGMIVVALVALYLAANLDQPGFGFALAWLVGGGVLVLLVALVRWGRRAAGSAKPKGAAVSQPVAICVSRPLLPVPNLTDAYGALPPHCLKLLRIGQR
jgi:hypothetical protein